MQTVLVTGGAGFIGSHLVEHLLEERASVRVLDNLSTGSLHNLHAAAQRHSRMSGASGAVSNGSRLEVIIGDIRDRELLRTALRNVKYVFHLAGLPPSAVSATDPVEIHAVNVQGTLNVLQGALTEGVWRLVIGSSAAVYGNPERSPLSEDMAVRPVTLFGASKAAAETYARAFHLKHQLDTVTLRYFSVYGPRQKTTGEGALIAKLLDAVRQRRPFAEQDDRAAEDVSYVDDVVAATVAAARAPRASGHIINVGSGEMATIREILDILTDLLRPAALPAWPRTSGAGPWRVCAQTALAAQLLEFTPRVSLIAGLARTIQSLNELEYVELPAFARASLND
jgi:nucleoside-diphosphate-sugar epimerase